MISPVKLVTVLLIVITVTAADTYYYGGTILTMVGKKPQYVECVLTRDEKIVATGLLSLCQKLALPGAQAVNLNGTFLMPGFIDVHGHLSLAIMFEAVLRLNAPPDGPINTLQDGIDYMKAAINGTLYNTSISVFGAYLGLGYDHLQWANQPQPPPTRYDLDKISTDVPVVWAHSSSYHMVLNSKALEYYNYSNNVTDPPAGRYYRNATNGELTGVFEAAAATQFLFTKITTRLSFAFLKQYYPLAENRSAGFGYTTISDAKTDSNSLAFFLAMAGLKQIHLDIFIAPEYFTAFMNKPANASFRAFAKPTYTNKVRVGAVKLALDGSLQLKTAWLTIPYYVVPEGANSSYVGTGLLSNVTFNAALTDVLNQGMQVHVHTIGDAAIDQLIGAVRNYSGASATPGISSCPFYFTNVDDKRLTVLHAAIARPDQLDAMVDLKLVPCFFGLNLFYWGDVHRDSSVGAARAANLFPAESAFKKGMLFSQHHDYPLGSNNPMRIVKTAMIRETRLNSTIGIAEGLDVYTALLTITRWAAFNLKDQLSKGCLKPGLNADLVILDKNPLTQPAEQMQDIKVLRTVKEGSVVFQRAV